MAPYDVHLRLHPDLALFVRADRRRGEFAVPHDGTSSLGHLIESVGVPLTEVGALRSGGTEVSPAYRPRQGDTVEVDPVQRPQHAPTAPPRFLLDVHLGTLARRLRLLGIDTDYRNEADDDELLEQANREQRVLLTQDRGLLQRRALLAGAYVRGPRPDDQLRDVLDRFEPSLAPWTRCTACNGMLDAVPKAAVEDELPAGTRRSYDTFARCSACGRVYWRGAHAAALTAVIEAYAEPH